MCNRIFSGFGSEYLPLGSGLESDSKKLWVRTPLLATKKSGIFDRCRDFYDWFTNNSSIWKVMSMPSKHYTEYNTLRDNALHTHTQHWSMDWNHGAVAWYAMPMCDVIIVSTISWMLRLVAAVVVIILNVRCLSWARLCCVWKPPNLSYRPVSALKNTMWKCRKVRITRWEKSRFYPELANIRIKNSG